VPFYAIRPESRCHQGFPGDTDGHTVFRNKVAPDAAQR
jgi:hypothetical protein